MSIAYGYDEGWTQSRGVKGFIALDPEPAEPDVPDGDDFTSILLPPHIQMSAHILHLLFGWWVWQAGKVVCMRVVVRTCKNNYTPAGRVKRCVLSTKKGSSISFHSIISSIILPCYIIA